MQPFERYFDNKMKDNGFKAYYEAQCHVCANTMWIFEKAAHEEISMTALAKQAGTTPEALAALRDADHCDPRLVIRLCRQLGLQEPANCPRLAADAQQAK